MAEDVNKLTDEEVGAIIQARYNSEMRQPENEEQRKLAEERRRKLKEVLKILQEQNKTALL